MSGERLIEVVRASLIAAEKRLRTLNEREEDATLAEQGPFLNALAWVAETDQYVEVEVENPHYGRAKPLTEEEEDERDRLIDEIRRFRAFLNHETRTTNEVPHQG